MGVLPSQKRRGLAAQGPEVGKVASWLAGVSMPSFPSGFSAPGWNSYIRCLQLIFNLQSKTHLH